MSANSCRILRKDWSWMPQREVRAAITKGERKCREAKRKGSEEWSVVRRKKREATKEDSQSRTGLGVRGLGDNNQFGDTQVSEVGVEEVNAPRKYSRLSEGSLTGDLTFLNAESLEFGDPDCNSSATEEADINPDTVSAKDLA